MEVTLNKNQYSIFSLVCNMLKQSCQDITINNKVVCQKINSTQCIFNFDLSNIISDDFEMVISKLIMKYDFIQSFRDCDSVKIKVDEKNVQISDNSSGENRSKVLFRIADPSCIRNAFIPSDELMTVTDMSKYIKVLQANLDEKIINKMILFANKLEADRMYFSITEENIKLEMKNMNKDNTVSAEFITIENTINSIKKGLTAFCIDPFILGVKPQDMELYYNPENDKMVLYLNGFIGLDETKVNVKSWSVGRLQ